MKARVWSRPGGAGAPAQGTRVLLIPHNHLESPDKHDVLLSPGDRFGWLLEELRVQLFAQELKTPVPVSVKRLTKMWQTTGR